MVGRWEGVVGGEREMRGLLGMEALQESAFFDQIQK